MAQDNKNIDKTKTLLSKSSKSININLIFRIAFVLFIILSAYISKNIYLVQTQEYKNEVYTKLNDQIKDEFDTVLKDKLNTSKIISSSLSKNQNIKKALILNAPNEINFNKLLEDMTITKEYVDIQVELIDSNGLSFKRSWISKSGDDLIKNNLELAYLLKYPKVDTKIETTEYGMTILNKIPIYNKDKFLGFFGVNIQFDGIVDAFKKKGLSVAILLNKKDSSFINQNLSHSKEFVESYYVVNSNSDKYILRLLSQTNIEHFYKDWKGEFKINKDSEHLVSQYKISNEKDEIKATVFIFKSLDEIDYEDLDFIQQSHIILTIVLTIMIGIVFNFLFLIFRNKDLEVSNDELVVINEELKIKSDAMDFNEKKMDNMFNSQPNLMIMHDGSSLTQANKRFMGFFNRFGTFDGFRSKHRCVSELFEKYEAPNYIWEQYIDGIFWIDYILKNPRRLYKIVMSYKDSKMCEPHHFIIKLNEMKYAKHVSDRIVIIALVDVTQDLVNYKTIEEPKKIEEKVENTEELRDIENDEKFNLKTTIENSTRAVFKQLLSKDIEASKLTDTNMQKIKDKQCIQFNNEYRFEEKSYKWVLLITAESLSVISNIKNNDIENMIVDTIDKSSQSLANSIVKNMIVVTNDITEKKVELRVSDLEVKNKLLFDYDSNLLELNFI
ncbi:MAG: hypothetical protein U9R16_06980, partial [Campylobacterota bacterium]|nr:hypothetical protein [Campylobacterota bacterium]